MGARPLLSVASATNIDRKRNTILVIGANFLREKPVLVNSGTPMSKALGFRVVLGEGFRVGGLRFGG